MPLTESATNPTVRRPLTPDQIRAFLPSRGPFTFPGPYFSQAIRLTNDQEAPDGCEPVGYSYWANSNNHRDQDHLLVFIGRKNAQPLLLRVEKATGQVTTLGVLPAGTGEGWYFSDTLRHVLYRLDGPRLVRHDVTTNAQEVVFELDPKYGRYLWQAHSSADDQTHSATVRNADYQDVGCIVFRGGRQRFFPRRAGYDECQIDKSGRYLVIKEGQGAMRIIDLDSGDDEGQTIPDEAGAAGHSDCGPGTIIGEDDRTGGDSWQLLRWDLSALHIGPRLLWRGVGGWGSGLGHAAVRGGITLVSNAVRPRHEGIPRANDLVVVPNDGSMIGTVLAPNLMGGLPDDEKVPIPYELQVKANMDPLGEWAIWTANCGGGRRLDAFMVRVGQGQPIAPNPGNIPGNKPEPKPKPKPPEGDNYVAGSQPYPDESDGGWWATVEAEEERLYTEAGQPFNRQACRWGRRIAYDIGRGMPADRAKEIHLAELRQALGL